MNAWMVVPGIVRAALGSLAVLAPLSARSQVPCAPAWEAFPTGRVIGLVRALAVDETGPSAPLLYAGGDFLIAGGISVDRIAAWNGTSWSGVGGGMDGGVRALLVFDDDGPGPNPPVLYAGGDFTTAGGVTVNHVAKWDGAVWSALDVGTDASVHALAIFDDDEAGPNLPALIAGGTFTTAGPASALSIAKWDGATWTSLGTGTDGSVESLHVHDDDGAGLVLPALYAGGVFANAGGNGASNIARWNGASWSALGLGTDASVLALATFDDDAGGPNLPRLHAAGTFTTAGGQSADNVARWNGASWTGILGNPAQGLVLSLTPFDPDGAGPGPVLLHAGGYFRGGSLATWNGSIWTPIGSQIPAIDGRTTLHCMAAFDADGAGPAGPELHVGGQYDLSVQASENLGKWDGSSWSWLGRGLSGAARASTVYDEDGRGPLPPVLVAGGEFVIAGNAIVNGIARWNGAGWSDLEGGMAFVGGPVEGVFALAAFDDDGAGPGAPDLFAGGDLADAGGVSVTGIARWNGSAWSDVGSGTNDRVLALAVHDEDGAGPQVPALYAGGRFTSAGVSSAVRVAKWNGSAWANLDLGIGEAFPDAVHALASFDHDGVGPATPALYAGGEFAAASGSPASNVAMWSGSAWDALGAGTDGSVSALAVFDEDGSGPALPRLIVAGSFTHAGGMSASHIAAWDGFAWSDLGLGIDGPVSALTVFDEDGSGPIAAVLVAGGSFANAGGSPASGLARWDGSSWSALAGGVTGSVLALSALDEDGSGPAFTSLWVGGDLTAADGSPSARIAKWNGCGSSMTAFCPGDGSTIPCPCGNNGAPGRGCQNSAATGGALLTSQGQTSLSVDTLVLTSSGERPVALSIFLQGTIAIAPRIFGDGLRCVGGVLKRIYTKQASGGVVTAPTGAQASVSDRSQQLGSPIGPGAARFYQTYYRDPTPSFCPAPSGDTFNSSSGIRATWSP